jgi:flavorubredoxin
MNLKKKLGAAFGAFGWSGESVAMIVDTMKHYLGMEVIEPGLRIKSSILGISLEPCDDFGKGIAERIKSNISYI